MFGELNNNSHYSSDLIMQPATGLPTLIHERAMSSLFSKNTHDVHLLFPKNISIFYFICLYLSSNYEKANCIGVFWTRCSHLLPFSRF